LFTTVAFYENLDEAGAWDNIAAIGDQHLYTEGDDLTVPELNKVIVVAAGICSGGNGLARLSSPSLRRLALPLIAPINGNADADAEPDSPPAVMDLTKTPIPLVQSETLNAEGHGDPSAAQDQWVIVWLADGTPTIAEGEIVTIRGNQTNALVADAWTNQNMDWDTDLPAGRYALVGMRANSAGLIAARAVPRGGRWRPGCLGCDEDDDLGHSVFRYGRLGVWFEFEHNQMPSIDFLSLSADTDQDVLLDIMKVG